MSPTDSAPKLKRSRPLARDAAGKEPHTQQPPDESIPDARAQQVALAEVKDLLVEKLGSAEAKRVFQKVQMVSYSGPLPPPYFVEGYNDAIPDGGHRIMAMAESEQAHRHKMQTIAGQNATLASETDAVLAVRGQYIGGTVILILVVGGVFGLLTDKFVAGFSAFAGAIATYAAGWIGARLTEKTGRPEERKKEQSRAK